MKKEIFNKIIGCLIVLSVITFTIMIFRKLPPVPRIMLLAFDVTVFYLTINHLFKNKKS